MTTRYVPRGLQAANLVSLNLVLGLVLGACSGSSEGSAAQGDNGDAGPNAAQDASRDVDPNAAQAANQEANQAQAGTECWVRGDPDRLPHRASPLDSTEVELDAGLIKVCYGRPDMRGRTIFGGLEEFGEPWRLGANEATAIYVPAPASIGDVDVAQGWYTLYAIPGEQQWEIVVNSATQRWGIPIDDAVRGSDVGSITVPVQPTDAPVEALTMTLEPAAANEAELVVEWENTRVTVPIRVR